MTQQKPQDLVYNLLTITKSSLEGKGAEGANPLSIVYLDCSTHFKR